MRTIGGPLDLMLCCLSRPTDPRGADGPWYGHHDHAVGHVGPLRLAVDPSEPGFGRALVFEVDAAGSRASIRAMPCLDRAFQGADGSLGAGG